MDRIPVFQPWIDEDDILSVRHSLMNTEISGTSGVVGRFEEAISLEVGSRYVTAVANGSLALDLVFNSLKLSQGDEVIIPNLAIISCLAAVVRSGATPVFIDVDQFNWNMSVENFVAAITDRTRAVLVVHTYGLPSPIIEIKQICDERNLLLIEDAAEAHGQQINGTKCGNFGHASIFSFYANKHIAAGEGGAICTNSLDFHKRIKSMSNLAFGETNRFMHSEFGWNYRISGLAAALGISQSKKLCSVITKKQAQAEIYNRLLADFEDEIQIPEKFSNGAENHYWIYGVVLKKPNRRDFITSYLSNLGIETRPFFYPLSEQPAIKKYEHKKAENLEISFHLGANGFYLPMGSHLTETLQEVIVNHLIEGLKITRSTL
jgi:perosamine synthetase